MTDAFNTDPGAFVAYLLLAGLLALLLLGLIAYLVVETLVEIGVLTRYVVATYHIEYRRLVRDDAYPIYTTFNWDRAQELRRKAAIGLDINHEALIHVYRAPRVEAIMPGTRPHPTTW